MNDYLPVYGMTRAELEKLNTRVCELAGLTVERCPVNFYQDAITALENTGARWVIRRNKDGYSVKVWTRGRGSHPLLCVAICQAIAGKGKRLDCDTPTIRDADGRVVHRAGNDRTYMPGDDMPEM